LCNFADLVGINGYTNRQNCSPLTVGLLF